MRIVSLLPSATEIVCLLGLREQLVGVTHECDYPAGVSSLPIVTKSAISHLQTSRQIDVAVREALQTNNALYSLNYELLDELNPDLLVTQSLCNVCAVDKEDVVLAAKDLSCNPKIINLEPTCLKDVYKTIEMVAEVTGQQHVAKHALTSMQARIEKIADSVRVILENTKRTRVVFLEWIDPLFSSGHWVSELVHLAGGEDCLGNANNPATTISWEQLVETDPDVLVIACCGYSRPRAIDDLPILQGKPEWRDLKCVKTKRVYVADGNAYFSRPSPRLIDSAEILMRMLHSQSEDFLIH